MTVIEYRTGDLLAVKKGHIVHGCNAEGVMGAGVARLIKEKYPKCYSEYKTHSIENGLKLGTNVPYVHDDDLVIWNAITQEHCGGIFRQVSYDAIETCFSDINKKVKSVPYDTTINIPMIGAGLANGNWKIIETIISETLDVPVICWRKYD
jgi:O-acetyl-ADP-ribose deacetylase (regulator of RNase III)